jgi:hypothetical protein
VVGTVFSSANSFVYMDGSQDNADEMASFIGTNQAAIESWVAQGGRLLINAGPTEGGNIDVGFGATIWYSAGSTLSYSGEDNESTHPILQGPLTPVGTSFSGSPFSYGYVIGGWLDPVVLGTVSGQRVPVLSERDYGKGHVTIGGLTLPSYWSPSPNATNLYRNIIAYAAAHGGMLLTTDGASSLNNAAAGAIVGTTATATLATIAATPAATLGGYDAIWVNPNLSATNYDTLRAAVLASGNLYQYVTGGGTLVLNVAGNPSSQSNIAPGGVDYDRTYIHQAESFTTPSHAYLTSFGFAGTALSTSDFDGWNQTDHGFLTNLVGGTTTVLSNTHGASWVEYGLGSGKVILTTLTYGWGTAGARGAPRDNLIAYAGGVGGAVAGNPSIGPHSELLFTLRIPPPTGDTLPPGSQLLYWPGVFDTGSTRVGLEDTAVTTLEFNDPAVPALLDVRLWGLSVIETVDLEGPFGNPQTETEDIDVIEMAAGLPSLIGGPVTNEVLADIDYGDTVTRSFWFGGTLDAPHTWFFEPGDPAIPTPMYWVDLVPFGSVTPGSIGQRYYIDGMRLMNGSASVDSTSWDFLYDTGNTTTQISTMMALALGINLSSPLTTVCLGSTPPDCIGGQILDGFAINTATIESTDGSYHYRIDTPIVFVQPAGFGGAADANIGTNFFDGQRVLFDGPSSRLGLNVGMVPEPSGAMMLVAGAAFLAAVARRRGRP